VTLIYVRSFDYDGETIYDFIPYQEFASNFIGFGSGGYKERSNYNNISTDVNNDYIKVQSLLSSSGVKDWKVDVIQAPILDWANNFILSIKVAPKGTQNFVRVQFPFNYS